MANPPQNPGSSNGPQSIVQGTNESQLAFATDNFPGAGIKERFDIAFTARLALREKQIQQSYRPVIGVHKWFARRPGTLFRSLLLSEFNGTEAPSASFWHSHQLTGVIADPFMGGGTPIIEANRLGFSVVGTDINPMAYWVVRQSIAEIDLSRMQAAAQALVDRIRSSLGDLYLTQCTRCGDQAHVKYFLWVKTINCPTCERRLDLFPGYLLAEAVRHPQNVVACAECGALNEFDYLPRAEAPASCSVCHSPVHVEGPARHNRISCPGCGKETRYPASATGPPQHRMWALEYHCVKCKRGHSGRFFKAPDAEDLAHYAAAVERFQAVSAALPIPIAVIPPGDETTRLHRWGYSIYSELFNDRQLLGLGTLLQDICGEPNESVRHALLTVFSDFLRYQNMLCRYDTYALKCQDIFSVHGFPVGLIQCENSLLGIPRVGSGSFVHFVEKYVRAKKYCAQPFETMASSGKKKVIPILGEHIGANMVTHMPHEDKREALLLPSEATSVLLPPSYLDGVFTDPPYFDNVQYAELMDFCFVWLRLGLAEDIPAFRPESTRSPRELTGNVTEGRGLVEFTAGLSAVYCHYAAALKPLAPFVFTYHHNDPRAYTPLVVAMLDAGLLCEAVLPAPAEMSASLHIAGTKSSVLDSVFVCRRDSQHGDLTPAAPAVLSDAKVLRESGLKLSEGDLRCLASGHVARLAVNTLAPHWTTTASLEERIRRAQTLLTSLGEDTVSCVLSGFDSLGS